MPAKTMVHTTQICDMRGTTGGDACSGEEKTNT